MQFVRMLPWASTRYWHCPNRGHQGNHGWRLYVHLPPDFMFQSYAGPSTTCSVESAHAPALVIAFVIRSAPARRARRQHA
jgi:hypothetical protein